MNDFDVPINQMCSFKLYEKRKKEKMAAIHNSKFIHIMFQSTGVNQKDKLIEDLNLVQILKTGTGGGTYSKCGESQESIVQQWRRSRFRASEGPERRRGQAGD